MPCMTYCYICCRSVYKDCREAHQLYQYAQGLGDLNTEAEEEKDTAGNNSFTDSEQYIILYYIYIII